MFIASIMAADQFLLSALFVYAIALIGVLAPMILWDWFTGKVKDYE